MPEPPHSCPSNTGGITWEHRSQAGALLPPGLCQTSNPRWVYCAINHSFFFKVSSPPSLLLPWIASGTVPLHWQSIQLQRFTSANTFHYERCFIDWDRTLCSGENTAKHLDMLFYKKWELKYEAVWVFTIQLQSLLYTICPLELDRNRLSPWSAAILLCWQQL